MSLPKSLLSKLRSGRNTRSRPGPTLFFTTDIHGSEPCFRKFLNAARYYDADILIAGGDITGKVVIPLVRRGGSYSAFYMGTERVTQTEAETVQLERSIRSVGYYPYRTTEEEVRSLETNRTAQNELFHRIIAEWLGRWMELAEERLAGTAVQCYIALGNDDCLAYDEIVAGSAVVRSPEGKCVALDEYHEMICTGYSTPTPWCTERECDELGMAQKIEAMMSQVRNRANLICCLHCPPYDSGIDAAPALKRVDAELQVKSSLGKREMVPVGSVAVRDAILKYQPLLGLHGHIHESRGIAKLGRTVCINPGSSYMEGVLSGVLVKLSETGMESYQLVHG